MKQAWCIAGLLLLSQSIFAQFGISGSYRVHDAKDWKIVYPDQTSQEILGDGLSLGVDYWFRLKNYRVEFLPELNVILPQALTAQDGSELDIKFYSLFFNINFYLFDFMGDCDCPTWSKQGNFAKKGFFVQLSSGITMLQNAVTTEGVESSANDWALSLGAGIGFDIGITDLVTFTPMLGVRYFPKANWSSLEEAKASWTFEQESPITQLYMGARLGFRFDYKNGRR
ncbi:MAG: hypothetical protein SFU99_00260 [Saprospiraceae bacterium]|nr:hypothetical protein [Saprospiraceae bacterium]